MAILHLPPPSTVEVRSLWGREKSPLAQGESGMLLELQMADVWRQWSKQAEPVNGHDADDFEFDEDEDFSYQPIKLPTVGTVLVRYSIGEPLRPRPFVFDDEDDDIDIED